MKISKGLLTLLAMGFLSTAIAMAQPAGGGGGGRGGRGAGGGGGGMGGGPGGPGGFGLDDQQRQLFQDALQKDQDKLRALDEKLRAAQKELVDATLAATYDEAKVKEKAEAVAKIQVEITMLRSKALATVAPTLKPEQKQQIAESRFAIMMLSGGFGGFGGGPGAPAQAGNFGGGRRGGGGGGGFGGRGGGGGGGGGVGQPTR